MANKNRMIMSADCKHAQHQRCESSACWCVCHPENKLTAQETPDGEETRIHAGRLGGDPTAQTVEQAKLVTAREAYQALQRVVDEQAKEVIRLSAQLIDERSRASATIKHLIDELSRRSVLLTQRET